MGVGCWWEEMLVRQGRSTDEILFLVLLRQNYCSRGERACFVDAAVVADYYSPYSLLLSLDLFLFCCCCFPLGILLKKGEWRGGGGAKIWAEILFFEVRPR